MSIIETLDNKKRKNPDIVSGQAMIYFLPADNPKYVLKRLKNNKRRGRFSAEINSMLSLLNDGLKIVPIIEHNANTNTDPSYDFLYYVMPYFKNGSLSNFIIEGQEAFGDKQKALKAFIDLASTINQIHKNGIFHRDIKPDNIFVDDNENLILADFGLCFVTDEVRNTDTIEQVGSRHWIAPELLKGRIDINDATVDYYSLGKVLYTMLTGNLLTGVGPYTDSDLIGLNGDDQITIKRCILGLIDINPENRNRFWEPTLEIINDFLDIKNKNETKQVIPPQLLVRLQNKISPKIQEKVNLDRWISFGNELKKIVYNTWMSNEIINKLRTELEGQIGLRFDHTYTGFTEVLWRVEELDILIDRDYGSNAMIRFQGDNIQIDIEPIIVAAVKQTEGDLNRITLLVGAGVTNKRRINLAHQYLSPLSKENFWTSESFVGDPLMLKKAEVFGNESATKWSEIVLDLILNEDWG